MEKWVFSVVTEREYSDLDLIQVNIDIVQVLPLYTYSRSYKSTRKKDKLANNNNMIMHSLM